MKIYKIEFDGMYYCAKEGKKIVFGSAYDVGMVDGLNLKEVLSAAIDYGDIIWMDPIPTNREEVK